MFIKSCENHFCIYWKEDQCTLKSISLDTQGTCQDCIYVTLEPTLLEYARQQMQKQLEEIYQNWNEK